MIYTLYVDSVYKTQYVYVCDYTRAPSPGGARVGETKNMAGIRKETEDQLRRRAGDMAEWRRRQDLYRAYDGPIPPRMMARAGDGEVRLEGLIRDGEERASRHDAAAEKWLGLGKPDMARRGREDAKLARDTARLNRDVLDKLRADSAAARPGRDPGAGEGEAA